MLLIAHLCGLIVNAKENRFISIQFLENTSLFPRRICFLSLSLFFSLCFSLSLFSFTHLPIEPLSRFSSLSSLTLFLFHEESVINWLIRFRYLSSHSPSFLRPFYVLPLLPTSFPITHPCFSTPHFLLDPFSRSLILSSLSILHLSSMSG